MTNYKIKYVYDTGDSFHTEEGVEGILEFTWTSIDIAKENLQRIKEHYEHYKGQHSMFDRLSKKAQKEKLAQIKEKDWFDAKYESCIKLKADNGNLCSIYPPWIGYFESLVSVEIIEDNSDRKIVFK
jgi:hypothetical protein